MRRIVVAFSLPLLFVTAAVARPGQQFALIAPQTTPTPPPPTPVAPVTVGSGRGMVSGTVVVDRQGATPRPATGTEQRMIASFMGPTAPSSWQNIQLEVKISDSLNTDATHSKTVSLLCLDGNSGQVRSQSGEGFINIDTRPVIRPDGRIYLQLTVEYRPELTGQSNAPAQATQVTTRNVQGLNDQMNALVTATVTRLNGFSESLNLLVTDGKPVIASQSADPRSDRKVTVEVTATVVK